MKSRGGYALDSI